MSITDSLSSFPEVFGEHYTFARAKDVFSNMRDRCPKEYEEKKLSIRQAAELLNVDHKTIHQRRRAGLLIVMNDRADNRYIKRMLVSMRDLADMLIEKPLKACSGQPARRYTQQNASDMLHDGWICPVCKRVYSPVVSECVECNSKKYATTTVANDFYMQNDLKKPVKFVQWPIGNAE
jgi:transposase-like protein